MINFLKELFWFQLLDKCPSCHSRVERSYKGGMLPHCRCRRCGWGETR